MSRYLPWLWLLPVVVLLLATVGCVGPSVPAAPVSPGAPAQAAASPTVDQPRSPIVPTSVGLAGSPATATAAAKSPTAAPATPTVAPATPTIAPPMAAASPATPRAATPTPAPTATAMAAPRAPTPTQPPPSPTAGGSPTKRTVLGYYVPYDPTSWESFKAHAAELDYVAAQWVTVDPCGNLGSRDDRTLIAYAGVRGVKVLPSLLTSSGWLNHRLLTDPATTDRFLSQIVSYVVEMGYPGFDLDLEGINAEDRDAFSRFVPRLAEALHQRGKTLTLAIPAKTSDVRTGWAGPYDYAALGRHADHILLMTYEHAWPSGPPGSIAPQQWVDRVMAYAVSQMPREKLLLGLAFYGYDWNTTVEGRARSLLHPQAVALAGQYGARIATDEASRSATFRYTARAGDPYPPRPSLPPLQHDILVRTPSPCPVQPPPAPPTPTPRPMPPPPTLQEHVVWLEDATSVAARLEIAVGHGLGGVGAWRLGQEDPGAWPHLAGYREGR